MAITVGINGYGRIGRNVLRALYEGKLKDEIKIVAINDLGDANTNAYLTRFDTVHGRFRGDVHVDGDSMVVNGDRIRVVAQRDPSKLPWGELGVDFVLECTGLFTDKDKAAAHLTAGAKKVIISAPAKGHDDAARSSRAGGTLDGRHTEAKPGFRVDDCKTQRNMDEIGRAQAKALGEAFRTHGVRVDRILASPVCRCMETAQLMAVGRVESSWALIPDMVPGSTLRFLELKEIVSTWRGPGTLVLVTHGLAVRPMSGFLPMQAETVVLKPMPGSGPGAQVVGRIAPPQ